MNLAKAAISTGLPAPLGLSLDGRGANIAVFSRHATAVELCLFDPSGAETRLPLPGRTGDIWHGHVPGVLAGQAYGLRAHGPWAPNDGHRFNAAKLLLDPHALALTGPVTWHPALAGDTTQDSAPHLAKCIATEPPPPIDPAERPQTPWSRTVIYEAHVKGLTWLWPGLPEALRGTIEALAWPPILAHLQGLGITAVELLPIHAFATEPRLTALGLTNYWGYNSASFFAPEPAYLGPGGLAGLRGAISTLHRAGIEVILDVVYNHTAEGDGAGPTLSFRGLDNHSYYAPAEAGFGAGFANETGCGNRVDLSEPAAADLVLTSLRYWAERIGVDGFRFDLAPALLRGRGTRRSGFLERLMADPVLSRLKLIVEPWDIGPDGYRLGRFPPPIAEWNDQSRDTIRGFWRGEPGSGAALGDVLLGSARLFDREARAPAASVNFAACHDGFTLADLAAYASKQNQANGEQNRDGHDHNLSENFGLDGPTDDPEIRAARARRRRNLLALVVLSQGTPMLRAGDEIAQSQGGNNNAYCQDNATSWIDWAEGDAADLAFCQRLTALRAGLGALRQRDFLHGEETAEGYPNAAWRGLDGGPPPWEIAERAGLA
ncbi:MAG: glycogen debranching protein GlgX, partial [Pseudomonadota bacterium]